MAMVSKDVRDIENLLALNPKVVTNATWKPSAVSKVEKKKWKRNHDKQCSVRKCIYSEFNWLLIIIELIIV